MGGSVLHLELADDSSQFFRKPCKILRSTGNLLNGSGSACAAAAVALLTLVYMYAHYLFASTTAHITAMFAAFYTAGIALGAPPMAFALLLAAASSIMMTLTHYATGTSPIIFGSGYTTLGQWWLAGLVMSVVNLTVWLLVGGVWWKVLGYW